MSTLQVRKVRCKFIPQKFFRNTWYVDTTGQQSSLHNFFATTPTSTPQVSIVRSTDLLQSTPRVSKVCSTEVLLQQLLGRHHGSVKFVPKTFRNKWYVDTTGQWSMFHRPYATPGTSTPRIIKVSSTEVLSQHLVHWHHKSVKFIPQKFFWNTWYVDTWYVDVPLATQNEIPPS